MTLAKTGTCASCGYEKIHCICHNKNQYGTIYNRNTSGERRKYQNYQDYESDNYNDYSQTSRISSRDIERKFMDEFFPVTNETLDIYYARTAIATHELIESSMYKHIYGGRKPWPSHTSSRYCPICVLCQQVETYRQLIEKLSDFIDLSQYQFKVSTGVTPLHTTIEIIKITP